MSAPITRRRGLGRPGLNALAGRMSERDKTVLTELSLHRFLTTEHVRRLVFTNHASPISAARSTRRVLSRLEGWRLIERLERRVGGFAGGAAASTWLLTEAGQRLLGLIGGSGTAVRVRRLGGQLIAHYLSIADTHLALREAAADGQFELTTLQLEPASWRRHTDLAGTRLVLKPDLYAITATDDYEDHWFIEVDRGTEAIPTLIRQCQAYARYRATGQEQDRLGVFPRVVWLLPTERRRDRLIEAIAQSRQLDRGLFYVLLTPGQLTTFVAGGAT